MLGFTSLSEAPISSLAEVVFVPAADTDIILRPITAGLDICVWPIGEVDDCTPYVPPGGGGGGGGGGVVWHRPTHRGRKSPWEKAKTFEPTYRRDPDAAKRILELQAEDDLDVVRLLAIFLGHI